MAHSINSIIKFVMGALLLAAIADLTCAQVSVQEPTPKTTGSPSSGTEGHVSAEELKIGTGDLLEISMYGTEDFHQAVRVNNSGEVILPLIGEVSVAGLSPKDAAELIRKKLIDGNFYTNPQISVFVKEYAASEEIYVLGEVQKPGSYSILNARDVVQAISLAGGTTQKASRNVTIRNPKRAETITINLTAMQTGTPGPESDVPLIAGDTIIVGKAGIVYVVGDVHSPTGIVMESENLTVSQAIALAHGTNPTAALDDAKLVRRGPDGPKEETFSLKKILSAKAEDIKVQPDDIIFVPVSSAKAISHRGLEAILQAATGIAMYSHY